MIEASLLTDQELPELADLWSQRLAVAEAGCALTIDDLSEHILLHGGEPRAILAIDPRGWIVARSDGKLVGFLHCTVGRWPQDDPECLRGILRAMILAPDAPSATASVLLRAANAYFRTKTDLTNIIAFHPHSGYPLIDFGRGVVFQEQWQIMKALGRDGYRLRQRWLFFERHFSTHIYEHLPGISDLKLQIEVVAGDEWSLILWHEAEQIAVARFLIHPHPQNCAPIRTASLHKLQVRADMQRQGIGRWLMERGVNHLISHGIQHLLVEATHEDSALHTRLYRLQFRELPLRGYTYEKSYV